MIRSSMIALAALIGAATFTASAQADVAVVGYGGQSYDQPAQQGYGEDNSYQQASYTCHYHEKRVKVKVVWYDSYGYPHYKFVWKTIQVCHKHYSSSY